MEETRPEIAEQEQPRDLLYRTDIVKIPWFYDYSPAIGVCISTLAVAAICIFLLMDPNPLTKCFAIIGMVAYGLYAGRYLYFFFKSRKCVTRMALLTDDAITAKCDAWEKTFPISDIVYSMSYSSSTNLCVIVATETDYLTMCCSCGYLFTADGKEALRPFYAINKRFMDLNPKHINYIKNKKYKRKNPFKVPQYVFEVEYDTPRVTKLIDELRETYRFIPADAQESIQV